MSEQVVFAIKKSESDKHLREEKLVKTFLAELRIPRVLICDSKEDDKQLVFR